MSPDRHDPGQDSLQRELHDLGLALAVRPPDPNVADIVLARLDTEEPDAAATRRVGDAGWDTARRWVNDRRRIAIAALAAALVLLLAVTPAGAKVREWLGFGGVVVVQQQSPPLTSSPAAAPTEPRPSGAPGQETMSLEMARAVASFPVVVPSILNAPDHVTASADHRMISMIWDRGGANGGIVRLDQIAGAPASYLAKMYYGDVDFTTVDGKEALWLIRPHPIVVLNPDGTERSESARLSGPCLLWQHSGVTPRLEGISDLGQARRIAASVQL